MWWALRTFLREPGPQRPEGPSRWDRWLVLALIPITIAEALLTEGLVHRWFHAVLGVIFVSAIGFRRRYPLAAVATAFGSATIGGLIEIFLQLPSVSLFANMAILLLPYSLVRWGSGRQIVLGHTLLLAAYAVAALHGDIHDASEAIGAAAAMLLPGTLGASIRFLAATHRRDVEHAKLRERAQIARDLHDTVAHHVSAITIQAQAGRAVLSTRPEAMAGVLEAIEKEATRTLSELRGMVGALRDERGARLTPQPGVGDIERLARTMRAAPVVEVELEDGLGDLPPAVQSALYRIAQESITNATLHARRATRVQVRVTANGDAVRLTVQDDGAGSRDGERAGSGFGLVGMAERAAILGGTLEAGPRDGGGWAVELVLPRHGGSR